GLVDPETGVLFNNRMRSFDVQPGRPNSVGPGKRPAQTLAPALGTRDDALAFVCATPGGPGQTGTVAQYLARVLACRQGIGDAIAAPRWAMMVNGDFILEETLPESVRARALAANPAAKVMRWGSVNFGSMVAIHRDGEGWVGGADTRRNAQVLGY
ncbi:MAG: gamma-glutamyltransferase, partial [Burkholderiales bacterium]